MIPATPLKADTYYAMVVDYGLKAASGASVQAQLHLGIRVRQAQNPVTIVDEVDADGVVGGHPQQHALQSTRPRRHGEHRGHRSAVAGPPTSHELFSG